MRGFDPASEDDLDDNGMNRYMENNDEEGWERVDYTLQSTENDFSRW